MTRQENLKLKNAMQNHDYVTWKHLTEGESINKKIKNTVINGSCIIYTIGVLYYFVLTFYHINIL